LHFSLRSLRFKDVVPLGLNHLNGSAEIIIAPISIHRETVIIITATGEDKPDSYSGLSH
jgi:hypothetical protein